MGLVLAMAGNAIGLGNFLPFPRLAARYGGDQTIQVTVKDAGVKLTGEVTDVSSKLHAARLAARVRGVRAISNELRVRHAKSTIDPAASQHDRQ